MLAAIGETFETPFVPPSPSSSADAPAPPLPSDSAAAAAADPSSQPSQPPQPPQQPAPAPALPPSHETEITGVIVSARKAFYRINIWTRSSSPAARERIENVGRQFKYHVLGFEYGARVGFGEKDKVSSDVEFVSHKDSQNKVRLTVSSRVSALAKWVGADTRLPGEQEQVDRLGCLPSLTSRGRSQSGHGGACAGSG